MIGEKMDKELNPFTGLYYNYSFMKKADQFIKEIQPDTYSMVAIDIEHFKLFNKIYGRESGDKLIAYIADCIKEMQKEQNSIAGYFGGDNFCVLMPYKMELLEKLKEDIKKGIKQWNDTVGFAPAFGVYLIDDITVSPELMYDRAVLALSYISGNYIDRISNYHSDMETKLEGEIRLLSEIQTAFEQEEFTFFVQPQCDIATGKIVGAESLVRWRHRTKGIISPGVFIPVLEKNGLISNLDRYVWKKVCEWLRSWIDRGYHPIPVSINISRMDIFAMDVPEYLIELLHTYHLPAKLIKTELTESAYAESDDKINQTVKRLRDAGFLVMMDDFGSGYSSLNMLKSVAVDVLKIDMRFLDINDQEEQKGIGILESVVNMARLMGLPIIVEGVETQKQEKFLLNMGCRYTQGYYYYKPLPIEQFERLLADERKLDFNGLWCKQIESIHVREFLDSDLFTDEILNNILGAAAFYEIYENQIQIMRVNEPYFQLSGVSSESGADNSKKLWNHVRDDDKLKLLSIFEQAYENLSGSDGYIHYVRVDGKVLWVYMKVFFLREKDGHKLFYGSLTDMTSQEEITKEFELQEVKEWTKEQQKGLEKCYGSMPCGYGVSKILKDASDQVYDYEIVYINHEMKKICGSSIKRLRQLILTAFENNKEEMLDKAGRAAFLGESLDHYAYSSVSGRYLQLTFYQYEYGYAACILRDVTNVRIHEDALKSMMLSYREIYFVNLEDNYCRMIYPNENDMLERGNYEEIINRHFGTGKILKYDEKRIRKFLSLENLREVLKEQDTVEYRYQRSAGDISEEWCLTSFVVSEREEERPKTAIVMIRSIDAIMKEEEERRQQRMAETLANMSDGFFIYEAKEGEKILYANPIVFQIFGCETMEEFLKLVQHSFPHMIHPKDRKRVEWEIQDQILHSEKNMDYIQYRIIRKDGQIRWIDDCGHLEDSGQGADHRLFYVFIKDITDSISENQKQKLLNLSEIYSS